MLVKLPREVGKVITRLQDAGFEAYVVGECVRDSILGRKPFGWDVTTNATLEDLKTVFPEAEVFSEKFGVIRLEYIEEVTKDGEVVETGIIVDVAPYRKDVKYANGLLVDSTRAEKIEDDLSNRDFTINAIAENHTVLADVFDGKEDIRKKLVRTVSDPDKMFKEDPIKMLRAIRLCSELGFDLHKGAYEAINANHKLLDEADVNKIREEFKLLMSGDAAGKGLNMLLDTGLVSAVLSQDILDRLTRREMQDLTVLSENIDKTKPVTERRLGLFYACIDKKRSKPAIERLNYDDKTKQHLIDAVSDLAKLYFTATKPDLKKFIYKRGWERYEYLANMEKAQRIIFEYFSETKIKSKIYLLEEIRQYREPIFPEDLVIDANDIVEAGICEREEAEKLLRMLTEECHTHPRKNTRQQLLDLAKTYHRNKLAAWLRGIHLAR